MADIGLREAFNDLWIWDTKTNCSWDKVEATGSIPNKRMYHSAGVLGGIMLVLGGVNTEARVVLDDFNLFDFNSNTWIKVRMIKFKDR